MSVDPYTLPAGRAPEQRRRIKVLSLSGGGYRGLFTAALIQSLEAQINSTRQGAIPFGQYFDLIVGTSIGGILGTGLSCGISGRQLVDTLERHGSRIFPAMHLRRLRKLFGKAPYQPNHLKDAIRELIPDAETTAIADHRLGLLLTTINWTTSKLHLIGSGVTPNKDALGLTLMDAMLATSAAPANFPVYTTGHHAFVDGGLAANAPDLHALRCAEKMFPGAFIQMLSIGTANPLHGKDPAAVPVRGFHWAGPVIDLVMNAQEMLAVQECEAQMGPHRYFRLNLPPSPPQAKHLDFDIASNVSTQLLRTLADECLSSLTGPEHQRLMSIIR